MRATVIIGGSMGDESKGKFTDYFVSKSKKPSDCMVVRFNGGSQAGHTVVEPSGRRHVFHHFGSGTFLGSPTYLGPEFIVNPMVWRKERDELYSKNVLCLNLFCNKNARVTTPYDMLINQEIERQRGNARHGSCGLGINETVKRCHFDPYVIRLWEDSWITESALKMIKDEWVYYRLSELGVTEPSKEFLTAWKSEALYDSFLQSLREFEREVDEFTDHARFYKTPVFEGAQGLLLDKDHRFFPHVTNSSTGITNVLKLLDSDWWNIDELEIVYLLRTYMTRHGRGPFPTEDPNRSFEDLTNQPNDWQQLLRFGHMDFPLIKEAIEKDLSQIPKGFLSIDPCLGISHQDQFSMNKWFIEDKLELPVRYNSDGPTREHIKSNL